jgi:hypothetical protein
MRDVHMLHHTRSEPVLMRTLPCVPAWRYAETQRRGGRQETTPLFLPCLVSVGKSSGVSASTVCTECTAVKYKDTEGVNITCDACGAGKYMASAGANKACATARLGRFQHSIYMRFV